MGRNKGKRKVIEAEEEAEDWCFVCKDGGKLLLCDYQGCGKAYHPGCVGKRNSILKAEGCWFCSRHSCSVCFGPMKFCCLCCPAAVCSLCARSSDFVPVKSEKGLCKTCFDLTQLAETNAQFNSEGVMIDFEEQGTEEFMFKDYLEIVMEQEDLTYDDLHRAEYMRENYFSSPEHDKSEDKDAEVIILDGGSNADFAAIDNSSGKRKETEKKLVHENEICDNLEAPFADKLGQSDSGENENYIGSCSENEDEQIMAECKRQRTLSPDKVSLEEKDCVIQSDYASIVADNIKLVYLRRSLVEELLMQPEKFEDKVVGGFVRLKTMPENHSVRTYHLLQVIGIKKTSDAKIDKGILLEVSRPPIDFLNDDNIKSYIPIDMLNDDDFSEEECADLRQRMKDGFHRQPTVMELEQKAISLHEDITKNWIQRQLVSLQNKIDYAHEKGRRYMLEQCLDRREMLKNPSEQQRLLQKLPSVIPEETEIAPSFSDSSESNCSTGSD